LGLRESDNVMEKGVVKEVKEEEAWEALESPSSVSWAAACK
jgi:hypothetical protein